MVEHDKQIDGWTDSAAVRVSVHRIHRQSGQKGSVQDRKGDLSARKMCKSR
jgi:hypothetical protein